MDRAELIKLLLESRPKPLVAFFELIRDIHERNVRYYLESLRLQLQHNGHLATAKPDNQKERSVSIYA